MANIKTAISIDKPLFDQVEALAEELAVTRSHLFTLAAREFVQRHQNRKLLEAINSAYDDAPDVNEENLRISMKSKQKHLVKDQW